MHNILKYVLYHLQCQAYQKTPKLRVLRKTVRELNETGIERAFA